jgi:lambda family phage portal protein
MATRTLRERFSDAIRSFRSGPAGAVSTPAPRLSARSVYKGAEFSRIYSDWIAGLLSPHDELRGDMRTLRARARELSRNNEYAGQFLDMVVDNVIGPDGMRLRAKNRLPGRNGDLDKATNSMIEDAWKEYFEGPISSDGMLSGVEYEQLAIETVAREGEAFPRRVLGREFPSGLSLQLIDPDLVDETYNVNGVGAPGPGSKIFMGIEVDELGRRLAYYVRDWPQYSPTYAGKGLIRIPASEILHLYRPRRANQMRGVTWLHRAMAPLQDLGRYHQNELVASAAGAAKMGFIENADGGVGVVPDDTVTDGTAAGSASGSSGGARVTMETEPGTIWELGPGQKFSGYAPDHPTTAFGEFSRSVLRGAASGLNVTYESLSSDLSQVTYLSARAGLLIERAVWKRIQNWWIRCFRTQLYNWWLESAVLSGALELPGGDWRDYRAALWTPRGFDWVDPYKDNQANKLMLELRLTSRHRLAAARGDDFEEILEELAQEEQLAAEKGIDLNMTPGPLPAPTVEDPNASEDPAAADAAPANGTAKRNGRVRADLARALGR